MNRLRLRQRLGALACALRRDHPWACSTIVLANVNTQVHQHVCARCGRVLLNEMTTIEPAIRSLLNLIDPGLLPEEQSKYMN